MTEPIDPKIFDIIEKISKEHCNKVFGYLDKDDLKNEIWRICLEKINDFDTTRGKLEHFLRRTVHNRLINSFKEITKSVRSPCPRCEFYNPGESPSDCSKFGDERYECSKWRNYQLSIESRNCLLNATEQQVERYQTNNILNKIAGSELKDIVLEKIDKSFKYDLIQLMSGGKISKQRLKKLKKEIIKIVNDNEVCHKKTKLIQLTIKKKNER